MDALNEQVLKVIWPGPGLVERKAGAIGESLVHGQRAWDGPAIRTLLRQGADPNLQVSDHHCLLDLALDELDVETAELLLGTPLSKSSESRDHALLAQAPLARTAEAHRHAHPKRNSRLYNVIDRLARATPREDEERQTPDGLDVHTSLVEALLSAGVDVDYTDYYGHTPLMRALLAKHHGILRLLLRAGASTAHRNQDGMNVVDMALVQGDDSVLALLRQEGCTGVDEESKKKQDDEVLRLRSLLLKALRDDGKKAHKRDYVDRDEIGDYHFYWSDDVQGWVEESRGQTRRLELADDDALIAFLIRARYSWPNRDVMRALLQRLLACLR